MGRALLNGVVRTELAERLAARREEIEEMLLTRLYAVADPATAPDPHYLSGLRDAVSAGFEYGLAGIAEGEDRSGPVPVALLAQARTAARSHVGLEVVLRRYAAGYSALSTLVTQETAYCDPAPAALWGLQRELAAIFDRVIAAVSEEYEREVSHVVPLPSQRLGERVRRLLAGDFVDTAEIEYDFEGHHLGVIASGPGAEALLRSLAKKLDRRLLLVVGEDRPTWAWLGGRRDFERESLAELTAAEWPPGVSLALGEPAQGVGGWRLTHRQAAAAVAVASRRPGSLVRYSDVAVLAAILRDEDLVRFLTETYLAPLAEERGGGDAMLQTLRAYFASGRNATSAAAALGVARQTVTRRLEVAEERIGRPLGSGMELETAARLLDIA